MIGNRRQLLSFAAWMAAGATLCPTVGASADDWPAKPIRLIVPMNAGGAADIWARIIGPPLSEALGQQLYVENHGGAGGLLGSKMAAEAAPDGYTLLLSGMSSQVVSPATNKSAIDPMRGFTHIAYLGGPPLVMIVHPSLGVKDFQGLLTWLRAQKETVSYASPGFGTFSNLFAELLFKTEKLKLDHVSYKGASAAMVDVIGGHVKIACMTWTTAAASIKAGTVVALAISSGERLADAPDVPTLKELGYPNLVETTWFALSGPARMPSAVVERLNGEVIKAMATPQVRKQMEQDVLLTEPMTPKQFTDFVQREIDQWGPIARQIVNSKR